MKRLKARFGDGQPVFGCQFVAVVMPKVFLKAYSTMELDTGFLEYRLPTYASALGIPFGKCSNMECYWPGDPYAQDIPLYKMVLTAGKESVNLGAICLNMLKRDGKRVFHPYNDHFPADIMGVKEFVASYLIKGWHKLKNFC